MKWPVIATSLLIATVTAAANAQGYIYGQPNTNYSSIGNSVYGSDGHSCTQVGNSTICN
ncbi:hypothetical protein AN403_5047 [Pseudomonas fluorescens]|uniref:Uncharacterized protein n=1 Tax=Pseudomonas fluorescens TaxID=294 RepID=A0A0N8NXU6_PSEFL|nr:hypothetical protein AN403_5047 [Pseudomonas fluorescens]